MPLYRIKYYDDNIYISQSLQIQSIEWLWQLLKTRDHTTHILQCVLPDFNSGPSAALFSTESSSGNQFGVIFQGLQGLTMAMS